MARVLLNDNLIVGLVTIPVGIAVAQQRQDVSFRTLHRDCGTPVKQKRFCPLDEVDVEADELAKGWEFAKGQYLIVEDEDVKASVPDHGPGIRLFQTIGVGEIDPLLVDRSYYLAPSREQIGRRPYALLAKTLGGNDLAALGRAVMWERETIVAVRALDPSGGLLVLETLFYAEDLRSTTELTEQLVGTEIAASEIELADQLLWQLHKPFKPAELRNTQREQLRAILESKLAGDDAVVRAEEAEPAPPPAVDLTAALQESLRTVKRTRKKKTGQGARGKKQAAPAS